MCCQTVGQTVLRYGAVNEIQTMSDAERYIQVILPLKLSWEPWYRLRPSDRDLVTGTRVRVNLAGRDYVAVVCAVSGSPDIDTKRVKPIVAVEDALELISEAELRYWRFLSEYYLCTIGEVYKYVYPSTKTAVEAKRANRKGAGAGIPDKPRLSPECKEAVRNVLDAFVSGKPVFLDAPRRHRHPIFDELARRTMESGKDVLILRPGTARISYVAQRELAKAVRGPVPVLIDGCRNDIFLPFSKLGLVIVDDEHDPSYKQSGIAPRYNARDAAIALASQHNSDVLLVSSTPSFETLFNVESGRFEDAGHHFPAQFSEMQVIGTGAEYNKNGMVGPLSRKLIARLESVEGKKLLITPWDLEGPLKYKKLKVVKLSKAFAENLGSYALVAFINAEAMISKNDFRADERMLQLVMRLQLETTGELIVQTRDTRHPVFSKDHVRYVRQLMEERHQFGYPPFTRMVDIRIADNNEARMAKMTSELSSLLGGSMRILLPKNRDLPSKKQELFSTVCLFETEKRYHSHISIDVDP